MKRDICIVLTPFQLDQLKRVAEQFKLGLKKPLIFHAGIIPPDDILSLFGQLNPELVALPAEEISLNRLLRNPFKEIPLHRKMIKRLKSFVSSNRNSVLECDRLFIGTEKDIFTQLLLSNLKRNQTAFELHAIEEGTGFYSVQSAKDRLLKMIYPVLSPLLFGAALDYFRTLGTHPRIEVVYARFPDELPYKSANTTYLLIRPEQRENQHNPGKKWLVFTSPLSEDGHLEQGVEKSFLQELFAVFSSAEISVDVKAHPREGLKKYESFAGENIVVLPANQSGENIDYFDYGNILHFGSSLILDIFQSGYPLEHVTTLDMEYTEQPLSRKLFEQGNRIRLNDKDALVKLRKVIESGHVE